MCSITGVIRFIRRKVYFIIGTMLITTGTIHYITEPYQLCNFSLLPEVKTNQTFNKLLYA